MLFPPPPDSFRYFKPKNSQGVLAKFCSDCGSHLDSHAYQWLTGGHGTVRACPPQHSIAPPPAPASLSRSSAQQIASAEARATRDVFAHPRGKTATDVDISLTSSVTEDERKTVGNVPAHHRAFLRSEGQPLGSVAMPRGARATTPTPSAGPVPRDGRAAPKPVPVAGICDDSVTADYYSTQPQQAQPHSPPKQYARRQFQLYDEAYSTPIPFGTEADLANPPVVPGPRGRRRSTAGAATPDLDPAAPVPPPRMSALRQRMERPNMDGGGGVCVAQDAVRPHNETMRTFVRAERRDALSRLKGAGGVW